MTELQTVELNLLKELLALCEKLSLRSYLVCGSALGAVKYGGFIPWDDDIDVALPRPDYERFCAEAPAYLPDWCFLQNYRSEPLYYLLGSKLRDSRTTYMEQMAERLPIHHGVFIDVFPLDGKWSSQTDEKAYLRERNEFEAARRVRLHYRRLAPENLPMLRTNLYRFLYLTMGWRKDTAAAAERFDRFVSSFPAEDSEIWCNHANSISPKEFAPRSVYGAGTEAVFEGLHVLVPERYDAYLTQKYGDWRADLPPEERRGHHSFVICDLHQSYTKYIPIK